MMLIFQQHLSSELSILVRLLDYKDVRLLEGSKLLSLSSLSHLFTDCEISFDIAYQAGISPVKL